MISSPPQHIGITIPPNHGIGTGNLRTAQRLLKFLANQGHRVELLPGDGLADCEVLIALNAVKSFPAISRFYRSGQGKLVVVVTGTDLNCRDSEEWNQALTWADRIVVLQERAKAALSPEFQKKTEVIIQSVRPLPEAGERGERSGFQVCVVGHFREEKDPMLTALASRLLDFESAIQIRQAGAILEERFLREIEDERFLNPRYQWLGELGRVEAQRLISESDLMVLSSTSEGGPAVVGEAVVAGTPILATRIDGVVGLLGEDYPGYFEPHDLVGLSKLMAKAESDQGFYQELKRAVSLKKEQYDPARESLDWAALMRKIE
ncbi:glycosyltransferase [Roseibacillus persicicus]|uniref:glycosyltransferase n=1 Tax=Roseibacillus persicicus TaxID=454148 RepID=UPI00280F1AD9|nr:glycosyltransferase [Roseibacillus persicicus]MDQ8191134.1 glycosyltransferase [Roseibacillus persicicus]